MSVETRTYDDRGEPVVVMVTAGSFDVSRLLGLLSSGRCEDVGTAARVRRQLARHNGGRAAMALLARHGGPDFTEDPAGTYERMCDWPGCSKIYHVIEGAKDGGVWRRNRRVLLCGEHATAGHWPDLIGLCADPKALRGTCSCGTELGRRPATLLVLKGWWQQHVARLDER